MPLEQAIMFDLGGVLIDWDPRYLYRKVYDEAETEFLLANVCTSRWNLAMDAGRPFDEAIAERQREWPAYSEAIAWWKTRWVEMLRGPVPGTVELLKALVDRGHPVFALTNWSAETFPLARERFAFLGWFRDIVVSGEVGLAKPDPDIYHLAERRCGFRRKGTVFIDDSAANIETARALGYDAIRFKGAEALRLSLNERGLL